MAAAAHNVLYICSQQHTSKTFRYIMAFSIFILFCYYALYVSLFHVYRERQQREMTYGIKKIVRYLITLEEIESCGGGENLFFGAMGLVIRCSISFSRFLNHLSSSPHLMCDKWREDWKRGGISFHHQFAYKYTAGACKYFYRPFIASCSSRGFSDELITLFFVEWRDGWIKRITTNMLRDFILIGNLANSELDSNLIRPIYRSIIKCYWVNHFVSMGAESDDAGRHQLFSWFI